MSEDILDYWVRLIKTIFPGNAWITSRFVNDDCSIRIDWKLDNDPDGPNRRSKTIEIIIKEGAVEDYLDKNRKDRELSDVMMRKFICERYRLSIPDNELPASQYASTRKWLISKDVLNGNPPLDTPVGDPVTSAYQ